MTIESDNILLVNKLYNRRILYKKSEKELKNRNLPINYRCAKCNKVTNSRFKLCFQCELKRRNKNEKE